MADTLGRRRSGDPDDALPKTDAPKPGEPAEG
jgi:hypothetical protein